MKKNYQFIIAVVIGILSSLQTQATIVNVTDSIKNNDFSGDAAKWTTSSAAYSSFSQSASTFEAYNASNSSSWFNCYQNITLPAGVYRLTAGAYHRSGNAFTNVILYGTTTQKEYTAAIKTLASETAAYGSTPGSRATAKTAFDAGYWLNTVDNIVVENENAGKGTLMVGIRNVCQPPLSSGSIWTIWSNFKLYKLEGADLDPLRDAVVAGATSLLAETTTYNDGGNLSSAISTLSAIADADLTAEAISTLKTAITTYKNNRISAAAYNQPVDVTHLIKNAGFEDGQVSVLGTANGHYNQPKGWTLTYNTASTHTNNNATVIDNKVVPAGLTSVYGLQPTEGNYMFQSRFRWTTSESMTISQIVSSLPAGTYTISADLGKTSANGTSYFKGSIGSTEFMNVASTNTTTTGTSLSRINGTFYNAGSQDMTLTAGLTQSEAVEATIILDNIKLLYWGAANVTANVETLSNINVYPTVSTGTIYINQDKEANIRIFDTAGRLQYNKTMAAGIESLQLKSSGLYLVEITSGTVKKTVKVMIVK